MALLRIYSGHSCLRKNLHRTKLAPDSFLSCTFLVPVLHNPSFALERYWIGRHKLMDYWCPFLPIVNLYLLFGIAWSVFFYAYLLKLNKCHFKNVININELSRKKSFLPLLSLKIAVNVLTNAYFLSEN